MKKLAVVFLPWFLCSPTASSAELAGLWRTDCVFEPRQHSTRTELRIADDRYTVLTTLFATTNCVKESLALRFQGRFFLDVSRDPAWFDHTPEIVSITLLQPEAVDHYNRNAICGVADWVLGLEKEVSGKFCGPHQMPPARVPVYDIFGFEAARLRFGAFPRTNDAHFPSERPRILSGVWIFNRAREKQVSDLSAHAEGVQQACSMRRPSWSPEMGPSRL